MGPQPEGRDERTARTEPDLEEVRRLFARYRAQKEERAEAARIHRDRPGADGDVKPDGPAGTDSS